MVKFFCAIVGVEGSAFDVDIDEGAYACELNEVIKTKKSNKFKSVDGDELRLFLAKKDNGNGAWLTEAEVAAVHRESVSQGFKPISSARFLKNPENFGENFQMGEGQVHVLVMAPVEVLTLHEPRDRQFVVDGVDIHVAENIKLNPPELLAFWRAFQEVPTEVNDGRYGSWTRSLDEAEGGTSQTAGPERRHLRVKADTVIDLPEGTFLLGDSTIGSRIYIRRCYPKLWEVCRKMLLEEVKKTPHLVIHGNSGIGKTYFGYVILLYLARQGKTIVYESARAKKRMLFSGDIVVEGSQEDFDRILDLPTTYYIVGGVEPTFYQAKMVLLTSLGDSDWYTFNKESCRIRYMPVWSQREIFKCRELMYSDIPESVVQDCFCRWGEIPRYVLQYAQSEEKQVLLEKALDGVTSHWLLGAFGRLNANDARAHRLLHYRVDKHFGKDYFDFASTYVQQEVYERAYNQDKHGLLGFITDTDGEIGW